MNSSIRKKLMYEGKCETYLLVYKDLFTIRNTRFYIIVLFLFFEVSNSDFYFQYLFFTQWSFDRINSNRKQWGNDIFKSFINCGYRATKYEFFPMIACDWRCLWVHNFLPHLIIPWIEWIVVNSCKCKKYCSGDLWRIPNTIFYY